MPTPCSSAAGSSAAIEKAGQEGDEEPKTGKPDLALTWLQDALRRDSHFERYWSLSFAYHVKGDYRCMGSTRPRRAADRLRAALLHERGRRRIF